MNDYAFETLPIICSLFTDTLRKCISDRLLVKDQPEPNAALFVRRVVAGAIG